MTATFELRLAGGFSFGGPGHPHIRIANKKACALFSYLALKASGAETRETLAGLLWSESSEEQARGSLRQCLRQLRTLFDKVGFSGLETDRQAVILDKAQLRVDVDLVQRQLEAGEVAEALLGQGSPAERILYGYESLDQLYTNWLLVIRRQYQDTWFDLLQDGLRSGRLTPKVAAEALIALDPTHEEAHRSLIRHYASAGNTGAALEQYSRLWDLLGEEYDTEPSDETQALIVEIKSGVFEPDPSQSGTVVQQSLAPARTAAPAQITPVRPNLPIIGIRPFDRAGPWDGDDYLIEGFRRELAGTLSRFREWSVFEFSGDRGPTETMTHLHQAGDIGFLYILDGTYFQVDDKVYQTLTLKQAKTSKYIWSEQIDISIQSWFGNRRQLLQRLAGALNIYLSVDRQREVLAQPTVSLDLYDKWLKGMALGFEWTPESDDQAAGIFEEIIEAAPTFAAAYSSLVQIENTRQLVTPGVFPSPEREQRSLRLAKTAVQVDPVDTKTHLALGWSYIMNRQFELGEMSFRLALELNRNDPWTLVSVSMGLAFCAAYDDALDLADQALSLDLSPSPSHWLYQSNIRFLAGRLAEAAEMGERAEGITHGSLAWHAAALAQAGDTEGAKRMGERFLQRCAGNWLGDGPPGSTGPGDWLVSVYPIRDHAARQRLWEGLVQAGVPCSALAPSTLD